GPEVRRRQEGHRRRPRVRPRAGRQAAAGLSAERRLQRRGPPRARRGLRLPPRPPWPRLRAGAAPRRGGGRALLLARRRRGGAPRAPGGDPPRTRAVASPPRGG